MGGVDGASIGTRQSIGISTGADHSDLRVSGKCDDAFAGRDGACFDIGRCRFEDHPVSGQGGRCRQQGQSRDQVQAKAFHGRSAGCEMLD